MGTIADSLEPSLYPQWARSPYHRLALAAALPVRQALNFEPRLIVLPEGSNVLPAGAVYEARVKLQPQSYIIGFSGSSGIRLGDDVYAVGNFDVQIRDLGTQSLFPSAPVKFNNISGLGGYYYDNGRSSLYLLPRPRLVLEPGLLSVQLRNLDAAPNEVQFVIYAVEPPCRIS